MTSRATRRNVVEMDTTPTGVRSGHIAVEHVTHRYVDGNTGEGQLAIQDVSFSVSAGEFVCVVGASGSGKSTILQLLAGLLKPTEGTVSVGGARVTGPGRDRGVVFQDYAMLPWKTVLENVALGPKLAGASKKERHEIARKNLQLVGLEDVEKKYPHELSGGMRQRAAVARTLAADPQVILMDEPFAAVDAQTRAVLQEELVRIWAATGKTVLFITHSVEESVFLADRVIVLSSHPGTVREEILIPTPRAERVAEAPTPQDAALGSRVLAAIRSDRT